MKINKIVGLLIVMLLSGFAYAAGVEYKIDNPSGRQVRLHTSKNTWNGTQQYCVIDLVGDQSKWGYLNMDTDKNTYAGLLSAIANTRPITIFIDDSQPAPWAGGDKTTFAIIFMGFR